MDSINLTAGEPCVEPDGELLPGEVVVLLPGEVVVLLPGEVELNERCGTGVVGISRNLPRSIIATPMGSPMEIKYDLSSSTITSGVSTLSSSIFFTFDIISSPICSCVNAATVSSTDRILIILKSNDVRLWVHAKTGRANQSDR
jgi:hypothetical protein